MTDEPLYTVEEVATRLRVSEATVKNAIRAGRLEALQVGRQYRIKQSAIDAWVQRPKTSDDED